LGKSTPAIRAKIYSSILVIATTSTLPLLVAGVLFADNAKYAMPADNFAVLTAFLD
jgi:hypothetical protein